MPARSHSLQELDWSCVAACVRMLQLRRDANTARPEAEIHAALEPWPITLRSAEVAGYGRSEYLGTVRGIARLLAILRRQWCIATVRQGPVTEWAQRTRGLEQSPHGRLAALAPGHRRLMEQLFGDHHAIVLVGATDRSIRYLDPWYPPAQQPLDADLDEFVEFGWTGAIFLLEGT